MDNKTLHKMEKDHSSIIEGIWSSILKWWVWGLYIGVGLMGKIGMYLRGGKKESRGQQIGSILLGFFGGFLAMFYCMEHYPDPEGGYSIQGATIVPIVTMMSDRLAVILWNVQWIKIIEIISGRKLTDKDKD